MSDGDRPARGDTPERSAPARWLTIYLKGLAMGVADSFPGVSGGTIALITGIYERLIRALTALHPRPLALLPSLHRRRGRERFRRSLREMDVAFLLVLGLGAVTGLVVVARLVHGAFDAFRAGTFAFFAGLIGASAIVLYRQLTVESAGQVVAGLVGFVVAFWLSGATAGGSVPHTLPVVFASGALAITAMVLPGVSGAFILLMVGQYYHLTEVLNEFVDRVLAVVTDGSTAGIVDRATVVFVFGLGGIVGLLTMAHAIRAALDRYRVATLAFLVSLMVGSLRLPIVEVQESVDTWTLTAGASVAAAGLLGAAAVLALDLYTDDLDYAGSDG